MPIIIPGGGGVLPIVDYTGPALCPEARGIEKGQEYMSLGIEKVRGS